MYQGYWRANLRDEAINKNLVWGPRYGPGLPVQFSSHFDRYDKPKPHSEFLNNFFDRSSNTMTEATRTEALRKRFFYDSPSIFANPAKPVMPIHGPPIETIIHTGPNVPGFTTAMRTPSEVARLEREVHTLRGNLLDRLRECPYLNCKRYFAFSDGEGLDRHLRQDHNRLQCFLCDKEKNLLPYYDQYNIRRHFIDEHYYDVQQLVGVSGGEPPHSRTPDYCHMCGRDQLMLNKPADRKHHEKKCQTGITTISAWCKICGRVKGHPREVCECETGLTLRNRLDRYCATCGLEYDKTMDSLYRERHAMHCKPLGGWPYDCCPGCGIILTDKTSTEKSVHISACISGAHTGKPTRPSNTNPEDQPGGQPGGQPGDQITPDDDNDIELPPDRLNEIMKALSKPTNNLTPPQPTRPGYPTPIGTNVGPSPGDVPSPVGDPAPVGGIFPAPTTHTPTTVTHPTTHTATGTNPTGPIAPSPEVSTNMDIPTIETHTPGQEADDGYVIWREAGAGEEVDIRARRVNSPPWDVVYYGEPEDPNFVPPRDWRCSRCFRAAGDNVKEIEASFFFFLKLNHNPIKP